MTSPASAFTLAARSDAAAPAIGKREGDAEAALGAVVAQFDRATADDAAISDDAAPDRRFAGVARLHGAVAYRRLQQSHAVVIGIGGVGSWAAEALARSAVGRITLIDLDHIAESNTNRQIHALGDSYGQAKVQAMAARIAQINPACRVAMVEDFIAPDNVEALLDRCGAVDVVIDCIDQVVAKAALAAACRRRQIALITCGAAGGRLDPTRLRCDDLARTQGDPLLAKVRARLRRDHGFARGDDAGRAPRFHVTAVFSDEPVRAPLAQDACDVAGPITQSLACSGYGSSVTVTAPMGFAAAAQALSLLITADRPRDAVTAGDVDVAATPAQQRATVGG
ncbi:MAG: tRNA threonylcarbamoyladenosine dehydratase [Burkholderiaceae bacterium]|nr:tRNA threonylcarbamoyladenosine dehydratase [Burkholderiaceae bacterium]